MTSHSALVGRTEEAHDQLSRNLLVRIAATLGEQAPEVGEPLLPLWHWCFFQEARPEEELGDDGHIARGGFLPKADNRNRMWAGGRVEFFQPLIAGFDATRVSTITSIEEKTGSTGALLFVTVQHDYQQNGRLAIREEQDLVYREPSAPKTFSNEVLVKGDWSEEIQPTSTMLFRYSAVTFNGHRIHYDWPYATGKEGYQGLVVHGPLIATLSLSAFCRANPGAKLRRFSYRGVRPLVGEQAFEVGGRKVAPGKADLWAGNQDGMAQKAQVEFV